MNATTPVVDPARDRLRRTALALALIGSLLLPGCALFRSAKPEPLVLEHRETSQDAQAFGEVQLRGLFVVKNPNDFEVEIDEVERTLRLQDRPILLESERIPRRVGPHAELVIPARMNLAMNRILNEIDALPEDGVLDATIQVSIHAVREELSNRGYLSAAWQGQVLSLLEPRLRFRDLRVSSLTPLQADYELIFDLENPNRYAIRIVGLELDLLIDGVDFGLIEAQELNRSILPQQTVSILVNRSQRMTREENQLFAILQKSGRLDVKVKGHALFQFSSPFSPLRAPMEASGRVQR